MDFGVDLVLILLSAPGPYGINHGIEIHSDVVEYSRMKLDEFKTLCDVFDEFEFCEPKFVVGNCLLLHGSGQLYDRVYCGAACPQEHENFMKNLLKIGGLLVMPVNDQVGYFLYRYITDTHLWVITDDLKWVGLDLVDF